MVLAALVAGSFITILNQTIVTPALPSIMVEMNVSASTVQWLTTGFTMVNAVMVPITAYLTDRFSIRRLFLVAMSVFTAGTLLVAWGPAFLVVLAGRLVQAAGAGVLMPMVMTVMLLSFPVEKRGTSMGVYNIIISFGPTFGPVIAGIVIDNYDWHILFYGVAVFALASIIFGVFALRSATGGDPSVKGVDKLSVVLSTLGFGGMLYGFSIIGNSGINLESTLAVAVGAVITVLFFRRQLSMERPMLQVRVLQTRKFLVATIISMVVQAATMANAVLVPVYVQTLCGLSATTSALVMLPGAILMAVAGPIAGRLFDRHGPRKLALSGLTLLLAGTVCMCFLTATTSMVYISLVMCVRFLGISMVNMPVTTWGMNALDNKVINHGNAVNNTLRMVAGSLGAAIVISAYSMFSTQMQGQGVSVDQAQMAAMNFAFALQAAIILIAEIIAIVQVKERAIDAKQADPTGSNKTALEGIMRPADDSLLSTATVAEAVEHLAAHGVDAVPLVDDAGEVCGFVSDGDILRALSSHRGIQYMDPIAQIISSERVDPDLQHWVDVVMCKPVSSIATPNAISVDVYSSLPEAARIMGENHLRHLPVVEGGKIVGIIDRAELINVALSTHLQREAKREAGE